MPSDDPVEAWCALDTAEALGESDLSAIEASRPLRETVIARLRTGDLHPDLFHACMGMGRLFASFAASPSLATASLDHLRRSLGADADAAWVVPARGALAEGYLAAILEDARDEALAAWDVPGCAVPIDDATVAVACGRTDDGDALLAWADRSASALSRAGYRIAYLAGTERAVETLGRSLALVGITVRAGTRFPSEPPRPPRTRFGLNWLRSRRG